jgi:hypothetical protein
VGTPGTGKDWFCPSLGGRVGTEKGFGGQRDWRFEKPRAFDLGDKYRCLDSVLRAGNGSVCIVREQGTAGLVCSPAGTAWGQQDDKRPLTGLRLGQWAGRRVGPGFPAS